MLHTVAYYRCPEYIYKQKLTDEDVILYQNNHTSHERKATIKQQSNGVPA